MEDGAISIHAPAKGATEFDEYTGKEDKISIHAPAKGATFMRLGLWKMAQFQSTLPRRERPYASWRANVVYNFNPRSREGSDTFLYNTRYFIS